VLRRYGWQSGHSRGEHTAYDAHLEPIQEPGQARTCRDRGGPGQSGSARNWLERSAVVVVPRFAALGNRVPE
jgi:hypothetical protein